MNHRDSLNNSSWFNSCHDNHEKQRLLSNKAFQSHEDKENINPKPSSTSCTALKPLQASSTTKKRVSSQNERQSLSDISIQSSKKSLSYEKSKLSHSSHTNSTDSEHCSETTCQTLTSDLLSRSSITSLLSLEDTTLTLNAEVPDNDSTVEFVAITQLSENSQSDTDTDSIVLLGDVLINLDSMNHESSENQSVSSHQSLDEHVEDSDDDIMESPLKFSNLLSRELPKRSRLSEIKMKALSQRIQFIL